MSDDKTEEPEELYLDLWEENLRLIAAGTPPATSKPDD